MIYMRFVLRDVLRVEVRGAETPPEAWVKAWRHRALGHLPPGSADSRLRPFIVPLRFEGWINEPPKDHEKEPRRPGQ
jgi:hypothetical protein